MRIRYRAPKAWGFIRIPYIDYVIHRENERPKSSPRRVLKRKTLTRAAKYADGHWLAGHSLAGRMSPTNKFL